MKLATVIYEGRTVAGVVKEQKFYALPDLNEKLPVDMLSFIEGYDNYRGIVEDALTDAKETCSICDAKIISPLPNPKTIRDFVGFEEHAKNAGNHFGMDMSGTLETWKKAPGFYFSNTNCVNGNDEPIQMHPNSKMFDFEFEVGFIIGKCGRNIPKEEAKDYIFGYTIFNDWSARDIQLQEIPLGVGAPLGKGYANSFGPVIVTSDEVESCIMKDDPERYDLKTKLTVNGNVLKENNINTIYYTFADMIAWASRDTKLVPGDVFGSGTIGGGCLAEQPAGSPWLQKGDIIEMTIDKIGTLKNVII